MRSLLLCFLVCISSSVFAINPDREYKTTPDSLNLPYEQLTLTTSDGYDLNAWKIPAIKNDRDTTIVLAYGDAGNMSYFLNQAAVLALDGYTVLLFDYRGFGKSEDFEMNFDYLYYDAFSKDLTTALSWAKENIDNSKTGIWSLSMGSIASTFTLQNQNTDFFIAEGFVNDPALIEKRNGTKDDPILLPNSHQSYKSILQSIDVPMLLIAGSKDKTTTVLDSKLVVNQKQNRSLVTFKGKHLEGFWKLRKESFGDEYVSHINSFVEKI